MQTTPDKAGTVGRRARPRSLADITRELEALRAKSSRELAKTYGEMFGMPTRSNNRDYLLRQIAWRLQDHAGHFETIRKRIEVLSPSIEVPVRWQQNAAREAGLAVMTPASNTKADPACEVRERDPRLPPVGTVLHRVYQGRRCLVTVHEDTFELDGVRYSTLTEVATAITGAKWNGYEFFKRPLAAARAEVAS